MIAAYARDASGAAFLFSVLVFVLNLACYFLVAYIFWRKLEQIRQAAADTAREVRKMRDSAPKT